MPPEKRRLRSPHPGVWIYKELLNPKGTPHDPHSPSPEFFYRGKWRDPDTGRYEKKTLKEAEYPTKAARLLWARDKADEIRKRKAELHGGASKAERIGLAAAIKEYLDSCRAQKRPRTVQGYVMSLGFLQRWAERVGLKNASDLTPATLARFAEAVKSGDALRPQRKTKRSPGKGRPPSPVYANNTFRAVSTLCNWLRRLGYAPALHRDQIGEAMEALPTESARPHPLSQKDCQRLLEASIRHDEATFVLTRTEHAAEPSSEEVGLTLRHRSIAPFVAFALLSGCRAGEARALKWTDVDLDAPGEGGHPVGEIQLLSSAVKNKKERRLDLAVSPALRQLLAALRLRSEGKKFVFGGDAPLSSTVILKARGRLVQKYGAPAITWQRLRQTAASYLTNARAIYHGASDYLSAEQLGHSPEVARRRYVGLVKTIPAKAATIEAAMMIEEVLARLVEGVAHGPSISRGAESPKEKSA